MGSVSARHPLSPVANASSLRRPFCRLLSCGRETPLVFCLIGLLLIAASVRADFGLAPYAVVRIQSHGVSGTVIWTEPGRSLILSCAHGHQGKNRDKPMLIDAPVPAGGSPKPVSIRLLACDYGADLTLIELGAGPLPYVCPVASKSQAQSRDCLSVGYDEMRWPAQQRPAHTLTGDMTWTRERPWHGRSGGALISESGMLVGVCHGYTGPPNHVEVYPGGAGLYISHATIVRFLEKQGWQFGTAPPADQQRLPPYASPRPVPYCPT
jgi:hypothetical protein